MTGRRGEDVARDQDRVWRSKPHREGRDAREAIARGRRAAVRRRRAGMRGAGAPRSISRRRSRRSSGRRPRAPSGCTR
jgi:hypothetical protein